MVHYYFLYLTLIIYFNYNLNYSANYYSWHYICVQRPNDKSYDGNMIDYDTYFPFDAEELSTIFTPSPPETSASSAS